MAHPFNITASEKKALSIATLIAILFSMYFFRQYIALIIFAAIMAFVFNPTYQRLLKRGRKPGSAATLTLAFAAVVILVPLMIIMALTGYQLNQMVRSATVTFNPADITNFGQRLIDESNRLLARTPINFEVTPQWIQESASSGLQKIGTAVLNNVRVYAGGFFNFFTTAIIFIFVFLSLLKNQVSIGKTVRSLNPLGKHINDLYIARIGDMTKAMVRGQFIIASLQGLTDAALIYAAGFHDAFFLMLILLITLSFIPLGGGIVAIPIGIIMMLTGNLLGGLLVIIGHLLIVTNIDNVLRPRLVPKDAKLDSALMILSVFAGVALVGFMGIIVGPVIMIVVTTTITCYLEVNGVTQLKNNEES